MFDNQETQNPKDIDPVADWCVANTSSEDIFIDCGAHIGRVSYRVIKEKNPRVAIAIEANPYSFEKLKENLKDTDCIVLNKILYENKMQKVLTIPVDSYIQSSLYDRFSPNGEKVEKVAMFCTTLDTILSNYLTGKVVIKMDIELAEWYAWQGFRRYRHRLKGMCMEFMPSVLGADVGINPYIFIMDIRKAGFRIYNLKGEIATENEIFKPHGSKVDLIIKK